MGFLRVVQPVQQMDGPGSDGAHAHPDGAGELRLGTGSERRRLFVAHADPFDAVLAPDSVGNRVESIADDAPHGGDSVIGERCDKILCDVH